MNRLISIFLLTLILLLPACNDDFLSVAPQDRYSDAAVWSDQALATAFVNDIYINLHYGFQLEILESFTDVSMTKRGETMAIVSSDLTDSYLSVLDPNHWLSSFDDLNWNALYDNIRATNIYFENIATSDLSGPEVDALTGEVHFLRAFNYYWLMSLFGGVPLTDTPFSPTDDLTIARSSLEETVNFIVADLDAAAQLLPLTGDKTRATRGAALALKARVLLYAASDLFNTSPAGYSNPELVSYVGGNRTARWQAAKDAAKAVIDLNQYSLYGGTSPADAAEATQNYTDIFLNHETSEDIFIQYYDNINRTDWQTPDPGLFYGPNGYHNWGNHTPLQGFVDSFEMIDGTPFDWTNAVHAAAPYENRDPRFYATVLYNGAQWRERPADVTSADPNGIIQTAFWELENGEYRAGLDTRQSTIENWNGTYTGYYLKKFIDPSLDHQFERQMLPWRQIRYAEVLLNYVEACLGVGGTANEAEARTYLNMIRNRAGMPDVPATESGDDLVQRYRNERKIELSYEQHRYFDIRRWMIAPQVMTSAEGIDIRYPFGSDTPNYTVINIDFQNRFWRDKSYFLPILLDEINRNELLIQNPGY